MSNNKSSQKKSKPVAKVKVNGQNPAVPVNDNLDEVTQTTETEGNPVEDVTQAVQDESQNSPVDNAAGGAQDEPQNSPVAADAESKQEAHKTSPKEKRGFFEGMMNGLGYVHGKKVRNNLTELAEALNMDIIKFEELGTLQAKFVAIKEAINGLIDELSSMPETPINEGPSEEETKIQELEAKVADLEAKLNAAGEDYVKLEGRFNSAKDDLKEAANALAVAERLKDTAETERNNAKNECADLKSKLDAATADNGSKNQKIQNILIENNGLKNQVSTLTDTCKQYKTQTEELQKQNDDLKSRYDEISASDNGQLAAENAKLKEEAANKDAQHQEKIDEIVANHNAAVADIVANHKQIVDEKDSQIATLNNDKQSLQNAKDDVQDKLDKATQDLNDTKSALDTEKGKVSKLNEDVRNLNKTIDKLAESRDNLDKQLKSANDTIADRDLKISDQNTQIGNLTSERDDLTTERDNLTKQVEGLEKDKADLTEAKQNVETDLEAKQELIKDEVKAYAEQFTALVNALAEAAAEDFLRSQDSEFENKLPRHQEKVSSPVKAFARAIASIDPAEYATRQDLENAYYDKVKSQLDESSGLTRIAQWYAYSCVPFMIDRSRMDGIVVDRGQMKKLYNLATAVLAMVGIRYVMPTLFVESINDDASYVNVTGQRQSNIEFMCPTARDHKSSIDRSDADSVIIDVLEIGYADNKGNNKNAQVII